jgi:hypothetical protein
MLLLLKKFERIIVSTLLVMMALTILLATIELAWLIIKDVITPPIILLEINELLDIFGLFLLVLLGIDLHPQNLSHRKCDPYRGCLCGCFDRHRPQGHHP